MTNRKLLSIARQLRQRQTDAEQKLWSKLRNRQLSGFKFRRQQRIGHYVVDFVCLEHSFIIELDGGHHNEQPVEEKDIARTKWLEQEGYHAVRFWNTDVLENLDGVIETILERLDHGSPSS